MMKFNGKSRLCIVLCLFGILGFVAPKARSDEDKDPPTRAARISFVDGTVSLQPGGEGDWGSAARNRPMTIGDKIWADKDSRAELQAGTVSIHLGSMTALSFLNLDQGVTQMRLAEGSINFRVSELREGDLCEVDAPNMAFIVKQAGAFRIDVTENGDGSRVTVIRGEGEVTAGGKTYPIHAGERAEFKGTETVDYNIERAPGPDGLDRWAAERDLKEDNSVSAQYVSRDTDGYSDLDDNGTWSENPDYGHVWYPNNVDPGWAPYSNGYWNYVGPWGWTWVDYAPWGFAPFHYGRWNYFGGRWGWCPGPYYGGAIYGPAYVGFYGGGFGLGIGWFPLGFGEPFFPWYHCRGGYIRNINIHNTVIRNTNVFNRGAHNFNYVNSHNVHAVTTANRNAFASGQAINRGAGRVSEGSLRSARVTNSVGITPTQHSSLGSVNMRSNVARPSAAVQNRTVIARNAPARGTSQMRVRTVNSAGLTSGRIGNGAANSANNQHGAMPNGPSRNAGTMSDRPGSQPNNYGNASRQRDLSQNRPPSSMSNSNRTSASPTGSNGSQRPGVSSRTWEAQGNASDRGRPPAGFGSSSRQGDSPAQTTRDSHGDRPPGAVSGTRSNSSSNGRSYEPQQTQRDTPAYNNNRGSSQRDTPAYNNNRGSSQRDTPTYNNNRGSSQPRSYNPPSNRSYSAPRTYSAPSRSYPAPSRSYSPPSHSSGGGGSRGSSGGGSSRGSSSGGSRGSSGGGGSHGGGSPHGGGSTSHGRH